MLRFQLEINENVTCYDAYFQTMNQQLTISQILRSQRSVAFLVLGLHGFLIFLLVRESKFFSLPAASNFLQVVMVQAQETAQVIEEPKPQTKRNPEPNTRRTHSEAAPSSNALNHAATPDIVVVPNESKPEGPNTNIPDTSNQALDLDALRHRAKKMAPTSAPLPNGIAPTHKPTLEENLEQGMKNAKRTDCRDMHKNPVSGGLLAVIPLVAGAVSDKGCKW